MAGAADLSGLTVLVVEDDFYLAEDARDALESSGAAVLGPCALAEEGLSLAAARRPDCAVLDVNLGEGPNFAHARALRAQGVPFVFVTGYDADMAPPEMRDVQVLQKPVQARRLVEAVARACGRAGAPA